MSYRDASPENDLSGVQMDLPDVPSPKLGGNRLTVIRIILPGMQGANASPSRYSVDVSSKRVPHREPARPQRPFAHLGALSIARAIASFVCIRWANLVWTRSHIGRARRRSRFATRGRRSSGSLRGKILLAQFENC